MGNSRPADEGRARTVSPTHAVIVVECAVARSGYSDESQVTVMSRLRV